MTAPRNNAAQRPSDDNTGTEPSLSGAGAKAGSAPGTPSGASAATQAAEVIAQAEEILAQAAAGAAADADEVEAVEAVLVEDTDGEVGAGVAEAAEAAAGAGASPAAEANEALAAELAAAKAESADWQGRYLRLHAEWETYRRRTQEQRKEERARATEKLVEELLPVLDDFDRTIAYSKTNGEVGILAGVEAVQTKLMSVLTKAGVEVIDPAGQAFDALEAQAVATVDDASVPDETVAQVYQKGFKMGGHVLRPAMVTVTTGGAKREAAE